MGFTHGFQLLVLWMREEKLDRAFVKILGIKTYGELEGMVSELIWIN